MAPTTSVYTTTTTHVSNIISMIGTSNLGPITWDDATWILTSSFIIFTMQIWSVGGRCSKRQKRSQYNGEKCCGCYFGGLSYWMFGFGLSFGEDQGTNPFCGVGYFFVDSSDENMGILFSTFVFQMSFATTATTIVSGAMAERTKLTSYIIFSFFNTLIYCIPAHWTWASNGFLRVLGLVDVAGSGAVHLVGGVSAFVAAALLKPRLGRYSNGTKSVPLGNPVSSMIGMFMLWWGWLAFNCGSTFGISGGKWKLAAKSAATTLNASIGGGVTGVLLSFYLPFSVAHIASCAIVSPWEALIIGCIGGTVVLGSSHLLKKIKVDDPVSASPVHGFCGFWGLLAVGLFARNDPLENTTQGRSGLFHGGGFYLLGVQTLACVCIVAWSVLTSLIMLLIIRRCFGLRLSEEDERKGADVVEHMMGDDSDEDNNVTCTQDSDKEKTEKSNEMTLATIANAMKNNNNNGRHALYKFRSAVRRGSLLSRVSSHNLIRNDKVVPTITTIPGETLNT
ncbi:hypothetical protein FSP39_012695 [Pinctada imbricata]|uniref:Ammonium transporter AmtB-like domain-containing protein n=1 Tax=Pinctada imbricata TaxID=66713 RepID=A0AA89C789_PINIB|nr:hypothetical protein FSP39_012695 [Pinctada imbricata]